MSDKKKVRELKGFKPVKSLFENRGTLTPRVCESKPLTEKEKEIIRKKADAIWRKLGFIFEGESMDDFEVDKDGRVNFDKKKKK